MLSWNLGLSLDRRHMLHKSHAAADQSSICMPSSKSKNLAAIGGFKRTSTTADLNLSPQPKSACCHCASPHTLMPLSRTGSLPTTLGPFKRTSTSAYLNMQSPASKQGTSSGAEPEPNQSRRRIRFKGAACSDQGTTKSTTLTRTDTLLGPVCNHRNSCNADGLADTMEMLQWLVMAIDSVSVGVPASSGSGELIAIAATMMSGDSPELLRVVRNLLSQTDFYSRNTGCYSERSFINMIVDSFNARGIVVGEDLRFISACDIEPAVQRLLCTMPQEFRGQHDHTNLMNQLPGFVKDQLYELGAPPNKQDARFRHEMLAFAKETMTWMKAVRRILHQPKAWPSDANAPCLLCREPCLAEQPTQEHCIKAAFAGCCCYDWSAFGAGKQMCGSSALPMATFLSEVKMRGFAWFQG